VRKGGSGQTRFKVSKLKDLEVRNIFKLALHNRFEGLQQLMEEEVDDEWRLIEQGYVETCEQVMGKVKAMGRVKANRKERNVPKNTTNMARTRKQKRNAESEAGRAEVAGRRGDARTLYEI